MIGESAYLEMMKGCAGWNSRLNKERTPRLPFLDQQTHIAQLPRKRTLSASDRRLLVSDLGTSYVYPAEQWKRTAPSPGLDTHSLAQLLNIKPPVQPVDDAEYSTFDISNVDAADTSSAVPSVKEPHKFVDYGEMSDSDGEPDDNSDNEDYEEHYSRRRRGARGGAGGSAGGGAGAAGGGPSESGGSRRRRTDGGSGRRRRSTAAAVASQQQQHVKDEPRSTPQPPPPDVKYKCQLCPATYKSRAGLTYHKHHVHPDQLPEQLPDPGREGQQHPEALYSLKAPVPANADCDFCLGDARQNKKTNQPEELVACHDCGRAGWGHPTCLSFTPNMKVSTAKYGWQCIECKSCAICGTSDNDHLLLFCDDCDRGFHLYCLKPPLQSAPEDEWSCHLCQVAFGAQASLPAGTAPRLKPIAGQPQQQQQQQEKPQQQQQQKVEPPQQQ